MTVIDRRPRAWIALVAVLTSALLLAGCGSGPYSLEQGSTSPNPGSGHASSTAPTPASTPTPDPVTMTPNIDNGATDVQVDTLVSVAAANGTLTSVTVSAPVKDPHTGKVTTIPVNGTLNKAKTAWQAGDRLEPGSTYTVAMTGTNPEGVTTSTTSTFTTQKLTLNQQTFPSITPVGSGPYGVAMPIIVHFDVAVKDHKSFQKHLKVISSPKQTGTWSWYNDHEVHYRPKNYWKPGTKITVEADLNGVSAGNGIYGQVSRTTSFTIGRSIIDKVNLQTHELTVYVGGTLTKTIPISAGKPGDTTRSGVKVVEQKLYKTRMASETIGIPNNASDGYDLMVYYAMRITNSGEFLHAAPWNAAFLGRQNSSHGCTGMSTADAKWLFGIQQIGDPVVTTGSDRPLEKGNGWTDWNVSYKTFAQGSAL